MNNGLCHDRIAIEDPLRNVMNLIMHGATALSSIVDVRT